MTLIQHQVTQKVAELMSEREVKECIEINEVTEINGIGAVCEVYEMRDLTDNMEKVSEIRDTSKIDSASERSEAYKTKDESDQEMGWRFKHGIREWILKGAELTAMDILNTMIEAGIWQLISYPSEGEVVYDSWHLEAEKTLVRIITKMKVKQWPRFLHEVCPKAWLPYIVENLAKGKVCQSNDFMMTCKEDFPGRDDLMLNLFQRGYGSMVTKYGTDSFDWWMGQVGKEQAQDQFLRLCRERYFRWSQVSLDRFERLTLSNRNLIMKNIESLGDTFVIRLKELAGQKPEFATMAEEASIKHKPSKRDKTWDLRRNQRYFDCYSEGSEDGFDMRRAEKSQRIAKWRVLGSQLTPKIIMDDLLADEVWRQLGAYGDDGSVYCGWWLQQAQSTLVEIMGTMPMQDWFKFMARVIPLEWQRDIARCLPKVEDCKTLEFMAKFGTDFDGPNTVGSSGHNILNLSDMLPRLVIKQESRNEITILYCCDE